MQISLIKWFELIRFRQWLKNLMLLFPPFLGGQIDDISRMVAGLPAIMAFCLAASVTYIINDIMDVRLDARHPQKCSRPIAAGIISKKTAGAAAVIFFIFTVVCCFLSPGKVWLYVAAYLIVTICYSYKLKHKPLVDIFCIAACFIFRLEAGGEAFSVEISAWLFLSVFLLALFLSTGKRCSEKFVLGECAGNHRQTLDAYPPRFLEGAMFMTSASVLVTYTMYVLSREYLIYTVPLCCFGLLRYIFIVLSGKEGDPTESLLGDKPLLMVSILWTTAVTWATYVL